MERPNRTDVAILAFMAAEPRSGYDLARAVEEQLSHFWNESVGNIYPRLKRLREAGQLTKQTQRQEGRPDRHVYSVTLAGRETLAEWFRGEIQPSPPRNELLLKVFFGRLAEPGVLADQVASYRAGRLETLEKLEAIESMLVKEAEGHPDLAFWLLTVRAGVVAARAAVDWGDETLAVLETWEDT